MKEPIIKETHIRTIRAHLSKADLEKLILNAVLDSIGYPNTSERLSWEVKFQDETEGSPPYKTGTRVEVTITEDISAQDPNNET